MENRNWWPNELEFAGDEHLDALYVAGYDRKSATDSSDDVRILRELGMGAESVVVDLGAGTGTFALAVAPWCGRVIAVDVSPAMLAVLRGRIEQSGIANIDIEQGGLLSYEHRGDPVDFVYSRNVLHHMSDFWKAIALDRILALLRPGGVLRLHDLVFACEPHQVGSIVEDWLAGAAPRPEDGWTRSELETHLREEFSTFTWLLEPMLERVGFTILDSAYRPARPYAAYTCVKPACSVG